MPRLKASDFTAEEKAQMGRIMRAANRRAGNGRKGGKEDGRETERARGRDRRTAKGRRRDSKGHFV